MKSFSPGQQRVLFLIALFLLALLGLRYFLPSSAFPFSEAFHPVQDFGERTVLSLAPDAAAGPMRLPLDDRPGE